MKIAPSILSADLMNMQRDVENITKAGADLIHVDIMDGHFVPNITFGFGIISALKKVTDLKLDVHLMIDHPDSLIEDVVKQGADMILIHQEATPHIYGVIQTIQKLGSKAGVVINPGTSVETIKPILSLVDQVLVMTVNPGFGGQEFLPEMTEKIKELDQLRKENSEYTFEIEVDGGVNQSTIKLCKDAGADIFVAGSYVFAGDVSQRIESLRVD
ncbi:ribulose-phosphate 3-epimerase [Lactobacillus sp. YT155]|uniref:ribulose-phosphate 3-epimerase n=1 Tax=Lactobacillus sp. YT155 TaxID=3060955 RepID=UPI00265DF7CF|nr:ribulose-phosphate 3-epimerase [Lactobacillus sp. YT155]MDO1605543.1 ribulose-phosphate 3-epimerase [Lactobacillus sp. YT155]